jgi:hypothetical protein
MVKKQEVTQELTNDELKCAIKLAIAKRRRSAIAVTVMTLAKEIHMWLPYIDIKTIIDHIKTEVKDRIITIYSRIGEDTIAVDVVMLYGSLEELMEEFKQQRTELTVKIVDAELDTIWDYKSQ